MSAKLHFWAIVERSYNLRQRRALSCWANELQHLISMTPMHTCNLDFYRWYWTVEKDLPGTSGMGAGDCL